MSNLIFEDGSMVTDDEVKTVDSPAELVEELEKRGEVPVK